VLKFQRAIFNGSGNIKEGAKHTKMVKNRVTGTLISQKSQNKLSCFRAGKPENISAKQLRKLE